MIMRKVGAKSLHLLDIPSSHRFTSRTQNVSVSIPKEPPPGVEGMAIPAKESRQRDEKQRKTAYETYPEL